MPRLRSAIAGRERWEAGALLRRPDLAREVEKELFRQPGVREVQANPLTGRVLVRFDPRAGVRTGAVLAACLSELSRRPPPPPTAPQASALSRVLAGSLPSRGELAPAAMLSVVGHTVHLLSGASFVAIVNSSKQEVSGRPKGLLGKLGFSARGRVAMLTAANLMLAAADQWLEHRRRKMWRRLGQQTQHRLRSRLFTRIQEQDLAFFDRRGTGELLRMINEDTARLGDMVERGGDLVIGSGLTVAVAGTIMTATAPRLALIASLPLPFMLAASRLQQRGIAERYASAGRAAGRYSQMLETSLLGAAEVKSFTAEPREISRARELSRELAEASIAAGAATSLQTRIAMGLFQAGYTLTASHATRLALAGDIPDDDRDRALFWFPYLLRSLTGLEEMIRLYHGAADAADRLCGVLESRPAIRGGPLHLAARQVRGEVVFDRVSFGYDPAVRVVEGVSFRLGPGETLAIAGRTGSGKSTLLRLLLRLYDVDAGSIRMDGRDIRELDLRGLRQSVGLVSQDLYLFQGSLEENLLYGRSGASREEMLEALRAADAMDVVAAQPEGLASEVGERGRRFSSGQRQRVAIARALLKDAPILALDEPTSHLDYDTEAAVLRFLRTATSGRSVILIAHRLATIRHADRILVLDQGRIAEEGTHDQLLRRDGFYATLWRLQSGEADWDNGKAGQTAGEAGQAVGEAGQTVGETPEAPEDVRSPRRRRPAPRKPRE